eukprot:m.199729 g.199729  ORF g.199729 m.199729 type:complete len:301 (-) comp16849_c0_seq2:2097-2999(-)
MLLPSAISNSVAYLLSGVSCLLLSTSQPYPHHRHTSSGLFLGALISALLLPTWQFQLACVSLVTEHVLHALLCHHHPVLSSLLVPTALVSGSLYLNDQFWSAGDVLGQAVLPVALPALLGLGLIHAFPRSFTHCESWLCAEGLLFALQTSLPPLHAVPLSFLAPTAPTTWQHQLVAACLVGALLVAGGGRVTMKFAPKASRMQTMAGVTGIAVVGVVGILPWLSMILHQNVFLWLLDFIVQHTRALSYAATVCIIGVTVISFTVICLGISLHQSLLCIRVVCVDGICSGKWTGAALCTNF